VKQKQAAAAPCLSGRLLSVTRMMNTLSTIFGELSYHTFCYLTTWPQHHYDPAVLRACHCGRQVPTISSCASAFKLPPFPDSRLYSTPRDVDYDRKLQVYGPVSKRRLHFRHVDFYLHPRTFHRRPTVAKQSRPFPPRELPQAAS